MGRVAQALPSGLSGVSEEAMIVGDWSSDQCGIAGWTTVVVELGDGMTPDQVNMLVEPLLLSGEKQSVIYVLCEVGHGI